MGKIFKLGDRVRCTISGFVGVVVGRCEYLHMGPQLFIRGEKCRDGSPPPEVWLAESAVEEYRTVADCCCGKCNAEDAAEEAENVYVAMIGRAPTDNMSTLRSEFGPFGAIAIHSDNEIELAGWRRIMQRLTKDVESRSLGITLEVRVRGPAHSFVTE